MQAPFVYIASLRRTGSTVLAEALTKLPYSFIFREPAIGRDRFNFKESDYSLLTDQGVDLEALARRWRRRVKLAKFVRLHRGMMAKAFRKELIPQLERVVQQVGMKEIRHEGWRHIHRAFPDMRVILLARDPRDVYLSLQGRLQGDRGKRWHGEFSPETVAQHLNEQFRLQLQMARATESMKVRYEEICTDPTTIERVKAFVKSPIPGVGEVGGFNAANPKRQEEYQLHGGAITDQRVNRWQRESNRELADQAQAVFDRMGEYCEHWGYTRDGELTTL